MIAAGLRLVDVALGHRRAAELAAPNHERVVEHAALLEVGDQRGARPGRPTRHSSGDVRSDVVVEVPIAVIEVNEPHAALGQPAGEQAVVGERAVGALARRTYRARACGSSAMSTSSGTLVCMRNASSYCAIRVAISGFFSTASRMRFKLVDRRDHVVLLAADRRPAGCSRSAPGRPSSGTARPETCPAESRCATAARRSAAASACRRGSSARRSRAGRRISLPRP